MQHLNGSNIYVSVGKDWRSEIGDPPDQTFKFDILEHEVWFY